MRFDVVVVGAGLSGSVAARQLAEKGRKVLVVERRRRVAGNCHDALDGAGITVHSHGPHIFHTKDRAVWDFANRFASFIPYQHRVLSYAEGRLYPFPINLDTVEAVFGLKLAADQVPAFLSKEAAAAGAASPPGNYRDAVVSQVGQRLYEMFFRGYTRKQWGREPEALSAELAKRVPVRTNRDDRYFSDQFQGVPRGGYAKMVGAILDHPGISLLTGTDWFALRAELQAGLIVYTGELDRYFDYDKGRLEYRSLNIVFETLDKERFQEAAVVNYPNDYAWTRISEFKWLTGERSDKTTICYEFPASEGEPYYIVPDAANSARREEYMRMAKALESAGTHLFIGRLAEYRYYDMDQAIRAALDKTAPIRAS